MADTRLKDTANQVLSTVAAGLAAAGLDVPSRQYIHSGEVAADFSGPNCADQLVVSWNNILQGVVGNDLFEAPIRSFMPLRAELSVGLYRCVPVEAPAPTTAALQASGEEILTDAMTLAALVIDNTDSLVPVGCRLVGISEVLPLGPQGGVGGCELRLTVELV